MNAPIGAWLRIIGVDGLEEESCVRITACSEGPRSPEHVFIYMWDEGAARARERRCFDAASLLFYDGGSRNNGGMRHG